MTCTGCGVANEPLVQLKRFEGNWCTDCARRRVGGIPIEGKVQVEATFVERVCTICGKTMLADRQRKACQDCRKVAKTKPKL